MKNIVLSIFIFTPVILFSQISQTGTVSTGLSNSGISHTNGSGSNRLLIYVLSFEDDVSLPNTTATAVTYGGQAMTQDVVFTNAFNSVSIWHLKESGIASAGNTSFAVTWSSNIPGNVDKRFFQTAFTLQGVDQTNSICATGTGTNSSSTNTQGLSSSIPVLQQEMIIYGTSIGTSVTHTAPSGYTEFSDQFEGSDGKAQSVGFKITAASGSENPAPTVSTAVPRFVTVAASIIPNGATCSTILPIELGFFKATAKTGNQVLLEWQTLTEIGNDFFTVERSANTINWIEVAKINGVGYSSSPVNYSLIDENIVAGTYYYRLKQTDYSSRYEYSDIQKVTLHKQPASTVIIYPNPASGILTIEGSPDELLSVSVQDILGRDVSGFVIMEHQSPEKITTDITALQSGVYYLKTTNGVYPFLKRDKDQ